jgi:hypothetical protein
VETSYLPAPEQLSLVKMSKEEVAEDIEKHIDYIDESGRSVHLPMQFVGHYMNRDDGVLPVVVAIAQLPIVLADGHILAMRGLDRDRGIIFRIPEELMKHLPKREDCTPAAVARAMQFLCDEWLCDVSTDYAGKCILITDALTLIERNLLENRPVFFITAGRRGGGKTTTFHMLIMAVFGMLAPAAAWSPNEEERRKAIFAYFMAALAFLIWDNIPRGTQISCPHIERSCTSAYYTDRKLGVSETVATAASTIHHFTGNNIGPKGDLASRSLVVRLEVDRADPENRPFKHNDPIGWTEAHRGQIMGALYTILLGNPFLRTPMSTEAKTRFKVWWRLCGSAVENAAKEHAELRKNDIADMERVFPPDRDEQWQQRRADIDTLVQPTEIDFKKLFLVQEEDDEESSTLADVLAGMAAWTKSRGDAPKANDIAGLINNPGSASLTDDVQQLGVVLREFLFPNAVAGQVMSAKAVSKQLGKHVGAPVNRGDKTLILRKAEDAHTKVFAYPVEVKG